MTRVPNSVKVTLHLYISNGQKLSTDWHRIRNSHWSYHCSGLFIEITSTWLGEFTGVWAPKVEFARVPEHPPLPSGKNILHFCNVWSRSLLVFVPGSSCEWSTWPCWLGSHALSALFLPVLFPVQAQWFEDTEETCAQPPGSANPWRHGQSPSTSPPC